MTKRMLVDATHAEETRVVVVDGNRLVDFDYESKVRKQLKGSIFLAKVTRVEPSLQAAFVNFGGNRHGFLPFSEIHPDYFRIPIADREALLAEQEREMEARRAAEEAEDSEMQDRQDNEQDSEQDDEDGGEDGERDEDESEERAEAAEETAPESEEQEGEVQHAQDGEEELAAVEDDDAIGNVAAPEPEDEEVDNDVNGNVEGGNERKQDGGHEGGRHGRGGGRRGRGRFRGRGGRHRGGGRGDRGGRGMEARQRRVEVLGGDGVEGDQPYRPSLRRNYKIQEVVKRGQIMLIQVSKEERGNKGAAVSTYLSLPGRYCVLMPNSPRAGGVSRKVANFKERKRMREILAELKVPDGMSVIMRTAGVSRTKTEIKRDLDYLMRLWDDIRETTLSSTAPALVHEEGNLIRRAIRDIYAPDIEDIVVSGAEGYKLAKDFMKMMIPSHVKKVKEYKEEAIPLLHRYQVESQIHEIGDPVVTLPSGGYLVINPTEALVSIDVNSGKATKERHIEETALRTNLEAASEIARQLRLRDLGGLIVIDFIDMEDRRNNRKVENRMRDALSTERARIQIGRISSFGLMELSRQRLNPSLTEAQFEKCKFCQGMGHVRTVDAAAILALRALEEEGIRARTGEVVLSVPGTVALYILNNKRARMSEIEARYGFKVMISVDEDLAPSRFTVEPVKTAGGGQAAEDGEGGQQNHGHQGRGGEREHRQRDRHDRPERHDRHERDDRHQDRDRQDRQDHPERQDRNEQNGEGNGDERGGRGRRRRGRRGGRRRNRFGEERDPQQQQGQDGFSPSQDNGGDWNSQQDSSLTGESETPAEAPVMEAQNEGAGFVVADDEQAAPKRGRGGRRPRKEAEESETPAPAAAAADEGEAKPARSTRRRKAEPDEGAPSNDTAPQNRDYETVNEPPAQKKRGWWNKLTD